MIIKTKLLSNTAKLPDYKTGGAACADLFADEDIIVCGGDIVKVDTNIAIELPVGYEAVVRPRSGLTLKQGLEVITGTIDCDYRGSIGIIIRLSHGYGTYEIKKGDRIAQLKIQKAKQFMFKQVDELSDTARGIGGFGHTGI